MQYQLSLRLVQQPEVLERVLRVVRHRGFKLMQMEMHLQDKKKLSIEMSVESERKIELLTTQLNKLLDVLSCRYKV